MKSYGKYVKFISYGVCVALIGSLLIGSPQSLAQDSESSSSEPQRLTVAPQTSSRIVMKTLPKALCVLHADSDSDPSRSLKMFSDDNGMIRFNVNPSEQSDEVAAFAVDCTADGQSRTFELELRPHPIPSIDMPAPAAEIRKPKAIDIIRPALMKEEALQLSDNELAKREYPQRPDPKQTPDAFANWLQMVTHPARRVDPRQVAHPELRASSQASTANWSGFDLKNAPNEVPIRTYDAVEGEWYVPSVTNAVFDETTFSLFWVGLDGDDGICPTYCPGGGHTSDLWQAGTGQQITSIPFNLNGRVLQFIFSNYYAWTELLPAQSIQMLANFNVSPGDEMFIEVWVGNFFPQTPSLFGNLAIAFVEDITRGEYTYVYNPIASGQILGYQAEWIMERPFENGALPDLADYNNANMYLPYAQLWLPFVGPGAWISYDQANAQQIFMTGSTGDLLSGAFSVGPGRIYYNWYNHH